MEIENDGSWEFTLKVEEEQKAANAWPTGMNSPHPQVPTIPDNIHMYSTSSSPMNIQQNHTHDFRLAEEDDLWSFLSDDGTQEHLSHSPAAISSAYSSPNNSFISSTHSSFIRSPTKEIAPNLSSPAFAWEFCDRVLMQDSNQNEVFWPLAPTTIAIGTSSIWSNIQADLDITQDKAFLYGDDKRWNWHKSWNLPTISAQLTIRDRATGQVLPHPPNLTVRLLTVKFGGPARDQLMEVGLKGNSTAYLVGGEHTWSGLKFSSTSYNHEGARFHVVVTVFAGTDNGAPRTLISKISTGIFVDSRKLARESKRLKAQVAHMQFTPFPPNLLDKPFSKKNKKIKGVDEEEPIDNSLTGLFRYFTAPNIRHKCRHPVFLAVRFSNAVLLLQNTSVYPFLPQDESTFQGMMNDIHRTEDEGKVQPKHPHFLLVLHPEQINSVTRDQLKKIHENLETVRNFWVEFTSELRNVPGQFRAVIDIQALRTRYVAAYDHISSRFNGHLNRTSIDGSDEDNDSRPVSPSSLKRTRDDSDDDSYSVSYAVPVVPGTSPSKTNNCVRCNSPSPPSSPRINWSPSSGLDQPQMPPAELESHLKGLTQKTLAFNRQRTSNASSETSSPSPMIAQELTNEEKMRDIEHQLTMIRLAEQEKIEELQQLKKQIGDTFGATGEANVGSSVSVAADTAVAVQEAYKLLVGRMGSKPNYVLIWATEHYSATMISTVMEAIKVPNTQIHAWTVMSGLISNVGFHSAIDETGGRALGMFGIADSTGRFGVGSTVIQGCARLAGYQATVLALGNMAGGTRSASPVVLLSCSQSHEEDAIKGITDALGSSVRIMGGTPAGSTPFVVANQTVIVGSDVGVVAVSILEPSLNCSTAFDSAYAPTAHGGTVTTAEFSGKFRLIRAIDGLPAAEVYNRWTGGSFTKFFPTPQQPNPPTSDFLNLSTLHPLGRLRGADKFDEPVFQMLQPLGFTNDGSMVVAGDILENDKISLLAGTQSQLVSRAGKLVNHTLLTNKIDTTEVRGALLFNGSSYLWAGDNNKLAQKAREPLGGRPMLGGFAFGEQGCLPSGQTVSSHMSVGALIFHTHRP
eukprot:GILK01005034.1.p1 GENE.GILK01005034.1~~GILK01005034.1.p1  ORF type:complete len:1080 (-),score=168.06 GILK01005034.1:199-3438(-)